MNIFWIVDFRKVSMGKSFRSDASETHTFVATIASQSVSRVSFDEVSTTRKTMKTMRSHEF
jgi:hypothetical protein